MTIMFPLSFMAMVGVVAGTLTISDPSDVVSPSNWEADNALFSDYTVAYISVQGIANVAPNYWANANVSKSHQVFSVNQNDTSVAVVTNGSLAYFSYDTFIKEGYSSNLLEASFYGVNAAVWVGNDSTAYIADTNVTVHNGAANIYVYGTGSVVYADHLFLYSSGPVSHGLYAAGNGTVYATNIEQYSGGYRSSAFSGDSPGGYVHVSDSVAHTDGHGSAICYALGLCNITNVVGHASSAPVMFMDSNQEGIWTDCDLTAGDLAGMVLFGSADRIAGAELTIDHSKLTVLGETMASLWFGNTIANATIISSVFNNTASNIFVVSNMSQVTQDFTYFAGYEQNSAISPAEVTLTVTESDITGDLVAYNGSLIDITFSDYSTWTGAAIWGYDTAHIAVHLDRTSNWTLTADSKLDNFTSSLSTLENVFSNGFNVYYNSSSPVNSWLNNGTIVLNGGGKVTPL